MRADYRSKRRQDGIPAEDVREVAIKVMVNVAELAQIEAAQSGTKLSRAEVIRAMILGKKIDRAPVVPEVNLQLARDLGRSLGNLSTVAGAMRSGLFVELADVRSELADVGSRVTELQKVLRGQQ